MSDVKYPKTIRVQSLPCSNLSADFNNKARDMKTGVVTGTYLTSPGYANLSPTYTALSCVKYIKVPSGCALWVFNAADKINLS